LIELFAGVGSQAMALRNLGVKFAHWKICEWEINAMASYKAIHMPEDRTDYSARYSDGELRSLLSVSGISSDGKIPLTEKQIQRMPIAKLRTILNNIHATHNLVDITQTKGEDLSISDTKRYTYLVTYSFPCQDLSSAGKRRGMKKGEGTRSGLLWEVERILGEVKELPQILLMENVPEVMRGDNLPDFHKWQEHLESRGYSNYVEILNAKDYGVAQNRRRCFMVSLLGNWSYRFPSPVPLHKTIKDYLESAVDGRYYIKTDRADELIRAFADREISRAVRGGGRGSLDRHSWDIVLEPGQAYRIRKLTERECWRLMGFSDMDFERAKEACFGTQLYKQAGNSIVVPVLEVIFGQLL
jgi:DNA (cytosine-5)-methyltransferase 1